MVEKQCNSNFIELRKKVFKDLENLEWINEIPFDTRQLIIKDAVAAYKSCRTNKCRGHINKYKLGYKSRKDIRQICHIEKRSLNIEKLLLFPKRTKKMGLDCKFRLRNKMQNWWTNNMDKLKHNFTILKEKPDRYYFCFCLEREEKQFDNKKKTVISNIVSLDPGIRTFNTFYTADGNFGKIGDDYISTLIPKAKLIDKLKSLITEKINNRTKYNMKIRILKSIAKIKNSVKDLHYKSVSFLGKYFNTILIPKFNATKISQQPKIIRNLSNNVVRNMMTLSHQSFFNLLKDKTNVIEVDERYTSKLCGKCGILNETLKSKKIFNCDNCGYLEDRDVN